jgi:hypothetical protein
MFDPNSKIHPPIAKNMLVLFFVMYPMFISFLKNKYVVAVVFALITWVITHLVIVPLSRIGWSHMEIGGIAIGIGILIITIGLPIALIADRYFLVESSWFRSPDGARINQIIVDNKSIFL